MEQYLSLKASAGSGKTFALTIRYISLLLKDVPINYILTLTFTNKSANDMKNKIYDTIYNLQKNDNILLELQKQTNLTPSQIISKKESILTNFLNNDISIYTIDKFINKILRDFSGYLKVDDNFNISNDNEDLLLYKFLISLSSKNLQKLIYFSYSYDTKLSSIVDIFKTLDGKNETLDINSFDKSIIDILIATILDDANSIKQYVLKSSLSPSAKNSVEFNSIDTLIKKGVSWLSKDSLDEYNYFKKDKNITTLNHHLLNIKDNLSSYYKLYSQQKLNLLFEIFNNFKEFRIDYKKLKNEFNFNDITNLVYQLIQNKYIDKDFLYFRLDTKYNHILIDEFQDTSVLQYKILEPLITETLSGSNTDYKTFFYVGDTKQSIYRFRGGNKELFDWVLDTNKQIKLQILDTNYRSSKTIVNFVNNCFENITNYEYFPQKIKNNDIQGYVKISTFNCEQDETFLDIKESLKELFSNGIDYKNIAILVYQNDDVLKLNDYLKLNFPNIQIITDVNSLIINQNNIKAFINYVKYIYFRESIYKTNFNALVGLDLTIDIDIKIDIQSIDIKQLAKDIGYRYSLFDDNYIKFIESLDIYDDIIDFIYNISFNSETIVNKDKLGLQILTVYKSKGLEFDTVLVLDRIAKRNSNKSPLLFQYDRVNLKNIYYKFKYRENFDNEYNDAIKKDNDLSIDDQLNVLYVSLTRASNNLIIFKKEKNSVFDILPHISTNTDMGKLHITNKNVLPSTIKNISYTPLNLGIQDIANNEVNSKSSIKAKYFGIATHYTLEMMKIFDISSLKHSIILCKNRYNNYLNNKDFDDIYNRILTLIDNKKFKEFIDNNLYTKEQPLIFNDEVKIIDLLIQTKNSYIIIDYKTTINKDNKHTKQVQNYIDAIKDISLNKDVVGYIVYLKQDDIDIVKV